MTRPLAKTDGPAAAPATQAAATPAAATTTIAPATNIMGYLDWLGDVSFAGMPFNEIDALIFAQLSYLDLRGYVPQGHQAQAIAWHRSPNAFLNAIRKPRSTKPTVLPPT